MQSLLLKSEAERERARQGLAAYAKIQETLDEISRINCDMLRRGDEDASTSSILFDSIPE